MTAAASHFTALLQHFSQPFCSAAAALFVLYGSSFFFSEITLISIYLYIYLMLKVLTALTRLLQKNCRIYKKELVSVMKCRSQSFQGSKKVPSSLPGYVHFPVRQVTLHSHLPDGQWSRQVVCQLNRKNSKQKLAHGNQNLRAACPKGKLEFKVFLSPSF